jgi:hypothetical protein
MMGALLIADSPALPLHEAGKYVAGAYVVLFALLLVYLAIMALRLTRMERNLGELLALSQRTAAGEAETPPQADAPPEPVEQESAPV